MFEEKITDIVGLYFDPSERAVVLCVDEKSQIQALDRTQPGLPLKKGRARSDFTAVVLARRGLFDGRGYYAEPWPRELVDHPFYYRKDRMASTVAAHLYGTFDAAKRQDIAAFAELKGLRTTWSEDFPSWWLPGRTTLVVYTPLTGPAQ